MANVKDGMNVIDRIVASDRLFVVLTLLLLVALLAVLWMAFRLLIKEQAEVKKERKEFLNTLASQQELIKQQQSLLEDEKKIFEVMGKDINEINTKIDVALFKK